MFLKKPKYYKDCSELPVGIFFKILETQDISLLCYYGKKKDLTEVWEAIIKEYEQLTGSPEYSTYLAKTNADCIRINRMNSLVGLYWLKHLDPTNDYSELETYWGVNGLDLNQIKTKLLQERTKFNIDIVKREAQKNLKGDKEKQSMEDIKIMLEENLNKDYIDTEKVSVKEWVAMCKRVEQKFKSLQHGRKDNSAGLNR
jgi:hypothetical protein